MGYALALALLAAGACEPSSATDREKGLRELRELEAVNARYAPPIPMSKRVGCEVCPQMCQHIDLSLEPLDELFRDYRQHAAMIYDFPEDVDWHKHELTTREIHRIGCIALRSPEGRARLLSYLDDESPAVQVATAHIAVKRGLERHRALAVLDRNQHDRAIPREVRLMAYGLYRTYRHDVDPLRHARQVMQEQASRK